MTTATTTAYTVTGMTCGGCVRKVRGAISEIDGVTGVDVQFKDRRVLVTSSAPIDPAVVQAAVAEAGYEAATTENEEVPS